MKNLIFILTVLLISSAIFAQSPQTIKYQAVVRDVAGVVLANKNVAFKISILKGAVTGNSVYSEQHKKTTNAFGLVDLEIGKGTSQSDTFSAIDWGSGTYFLKVELDPTGGTSFVIMGTSQLLSVPYALYSETSGDAVKITGDQTISGKKTFTDTINAGNNPIKRVASPVKPKDAVNKEYVDKILYSLGLIPNNFDGIVEDIDGNVYKTIKLGTQEWMAENLKVTKYNDGVGFENKVNNGVWSNANYGAWCNYNNDKDNNAIYGLLYNWYAVNTGKLCPMGWHVPTDAEWTTLENYLISNGYNYDGTTSGNEIAKSLAAKTNWGASAYNAPGLPCDEIYDNNKSGFSGLPGGERQQDDGSFDGIINIGCWWSSTEHSTSSSYSWYRSLIRDDTCLLRSPGNKGDGFSVRCVCDE